MGRPSSIPEVVEKEVVDDPVQLDITPKQAEDMKLIESKAERVKKPRSEKQMEATKKLIEKNKAWREKLKAEKALGKPDNHIQGLLADKADDATTEPSSQSEVRKTKIRFRIRKPVVHPRPNHHLKRKASSQLVPRADDSDVGSTSVVESDLDTDAVVEELRRRAQAPAPSQSSSSKKFIPMM